VVTADRYVGFEAWYRRIHPRLIAALLAFSGSVEVAADATDEACTRAMGAWGRVSAMESPDAWVYRVAVNCAKRRLRRQAFERAVLARRRPAEPLPGPAGEIWQAVGQLSERQRTAVVLRYVVDLPEAEIAQVMGVTRGTVASTLADARRRLGEALADESEELSSGPG
jgi:DNA-directed RNA polymerase specialized sigma24 family protein